MSGNNRRASLRSLLAAGLALGPLVGCGSNKLETGYAYRPLNATDVERRAYYSSKYSKQAVKAEQERESEFRSRRPGIQQ